MESVYVIQPVGAEDVRTKHEEIVALIESAGAEYIGTSYQNVREINPATYIGSGKLAEIGEKLEGREVTVLFNGDLTPSQTLNISAALGDRKVIDRTTLILDIFALRAQSSEGKLQVELAQLNYLYPRLRGKGSALSRLGGGIGTRGPGESKLETDRRHIRARIHALKERLSEVEKRRKFCTERRKKERVRTIALVGYTNVGKSTLMNALTGADVLVKDELFATLDPTARALRIEGIPFLLVDTVGFLQDLPHHLIDAFKSTLESALNCDLALIVCDSTGEYEMQLKTTLDTLHDMDFHAPYLVVLNKCDVGDPVRLPCEDPVLVSARTGLGLEDLKGRIFGALQADLLRVTLFVPYRDMAAYGALRKHLSERAVEYTDDGARIAAILPAEYAERFRAFLIK